MSAPTQAVYGHAASTLTACVDCPPWQPRWACVRADDDERPLCATCYRATLTTPEGPTCPPAPSPSC